MDKRLVAFLMDHAEHVDINIQWKNDKAVVLQSYGFTNQESVEVLGNFDGYLRSQIGIISPVPGSPA